MNQKRPLLKIEFEKCSWKKFGWRNYCVMFFGISWRACGFEVSFWKFHNVFIWGQKVAAFEKPNEPMAEDTIRE